MPSLVEQVLRRQLEVRPRPGLPTALDEGMYPPTLAYPPVASVGQRLRRSGLGLAILCATAFGAVRIDHYLVSRSLAAAALPVEVAAANPVSTPEQLILPGETAAWHRSTVYAHVDGDVAKWFVDIGDEVTKGQVLCLLDTPEADAQLAAARAQLGASQAQVRIHLADVDFARTTYERWRDSPRGVVSDQERAAKRAAYRGASARLMAAQAQLAIDQQRVAHLAALAALKQVTAPLSGVVTKRYIDIGRAVTAAGSTGSPTPLYQLVQDDPMRVFVQASQSVAADLMRPGIPARVRVSGGSRPQPYYGTVTRTAAALDDRTRSLEVEVDLPNASHQLVSGMSARVAFSVPPRGQVQVPAAAVLSRGGVPQIAQVDSSDRVRFHTVSIARNDGDVVELSSGVRPGELLALIALHGGGRLAEGDRVKVIRNPSRAPAASTMTALR